MLQARLAVIGNRIVQAGLDAGCGQPRAQGIALRRANDEQMPDVVVVAYRRHCKRQVRQVPAVAFGELTPACGPAVEMPQLVPQHHGLHPVHAVVVTDFGVNIALRLAMIAQRTKPLRVRIVARGNQSSLAGGPQVLAWVEAEAPEPAERSDRTAAPARA